MYSPTERALSPKLDKTNSNNEGSDCGSVGRVVAVARVSNILIPPGNCWKDEIKEQCLTMTYYKEFYELVFQF